MRSFFKKHSFLIAALAILLLGAFFRFRDYPKRFAFNADQGRDALIAREIVEDKVLPLVGPPSSGGPFSYGPWYYWILSLSFLFSQKILLAPWVITTLISVFFVLVMIIAGYYLNGKMLALILGLLSAFSTAEIRVSAHLADVALVSFFSALTVLSVILLVKLKKPLYSFLVGFFCSLAINMHFSAFLFAPILIAPLFAGKKKLFVNALLLFFGFLIPFAPLIIVNINHSWIMLKNIMDFFLYGKSNLWVSNRWLTYVFQFWPQLWAEIVGGTNLTSFLIVFLLGLFLVKDFLKRKLRLEIVALLVIFFLQVVLLRYWTGERQAVWLLFFNPLVIVFTGWVIVKIIKANAILGVLFASLLVFTSYKNNVYHWEYVNQFEKIALLKKDILFYIPEGKVSLYECSGHSVIRDTTLPLLYLLEIENKIDRNGIPVVISLDSSKDKRFSQAKKISSDVFIISDKKLLPQDCYFMDQKRVYEETMTLNL